MKIFFLLISFYGLMASAEVKIAFVEIHYPDGQIHQLEPGGRFSHIAISYKGKWLHAHPYHGVEIVPMSDLEKIGIVQVVTLPNLNEITPEQLAQYIGKPYDPTFSWDSEGYYCSELVGKILKIEPQPMKFSSDIWQGRAKSRSIGLSPDDIFAEIQRAPRCQSLFN